MHMLCTITHYLVAKLCHIQPWLTNLLITKTFFYWQEGESKPKTLRLIPQQCIQIKSLAIYYVHACYIQVACMLHMSNTCVTCKGYCE